MPRRRSASALSRRAVVAAGLLSLASPTMARFEDQLAAFARADRAHPSRDGALLFVGSSTIRLWPELERTFAPAPVVQRGFGGATLEEVHRHRARLFHPHRPAAVVVYAGENDVAQGAAPATVVARWRRLHAALAGTPAGAAPVVFIDLKPSPARFALWPRMRAANAGMRRLADAAPAAFVDTADVVLGDDGRPRAELFAPDGVHFNARGYDRLTAALRAVLVRAGLIG